jgi:cytochrome c biogenesis protein CcmG/thiol:disulfide interchange protein DsbE
VVALVAVLAVGLRRPAHRLPSPLVGRAAPAFTLPLLDGGVLGSADLRGQVVVVNFWASWCYPACYDEAPHLQRLWERYRSRGVVVVGVNIQDTEAAARDFVRRFGQTFPVGMDRSGTIAIDFGVVGVPETYLIDRQGRIVFKHAGTVTEDLLAARIEPLLQQR